MHFSELELKNLGRNRLTLGKWSKKAHSDIHWLTKTISKVFFFFCLWRYNSPTDSSFQWAHHLKHNDKWKERVITATPSQPLTLNITFKIPSISQTLFSMVYWFRTNTKILLIISMKILNDELWELNAWKTNATVHHA